MIVAWFEMGVLIGATNIVWVVVSLAMPDVWEFSAIAHVYLMPEWLYAATHEFLAARTYRFLQAAPRAQIMKDAKRITAGLSSAIRGIFG